VFCTFRSELSWTEVSGSRSLPHTHVGKLSVTLAVTKQFDRLSDWCSRCARDGKLAFLGIACVEGAAGKHVQRSPYKPTVRPAEPWNECCWKDDRSTRRAGEFHWSRNAWVSFFDLYRLGRYGTFRDGLGNKRSRRTAYFNLKLPLGPSVRRSGKNLWNGEREFCVASELGSVVFLEINSLHLPWSLTIHLH